MSNTQTTAPACDDARADTVWAQRCATLHNAWVQVRYHRKRQRFFDLADKLTKSATVVLGGSLLGQSLKNLQPLVASAIASLGLLALVFGYGDRKQLHRELAEQAAALVGSIEQVPAGELTPARTASWGADYARLCAKAPPPLKTLSLMCEGEQATADGHPEHVRLPSWPKRALSNFMA